MMEIAHHLRCSHHKVAYWMGRYKIARRSWSEASYTKHNPTEPFKIKTNLSPKEEKLKAIALGIYLGEGNKRSRDTVRVGNSEPLILQFFVKFLRTICGVQAEKIKASLIVHPDVKIQETEHFWSQRLNIPLPQFSKTIVIKPRGRGTYTHRCSYGVATVYVCNTKLRQLIDVWISQYARVAQSAERNHGKIEAGSSILPPGLFLCRT